MGCASGVAPDVSGDRISGGIVLLIGLCRKSIFCSVLRFANDSGISLMLLSKRSSRVRLERFTIDSGISTI